MPWATATHRRLPRNPVHRVPERNRQAVRTLPTNSTAWRRIRASILAMEPLCRQCGIEGRVREASQVDHIDGDPSNNADDNLQPLCASCHSRKTAVQDGGFGNRKIAK